MIPYILNTALILTGCFLFYKLLLQKETFYQVNRIVLLGCMVLSFALPSVRVPQQWSIRKAGTPISINPTKPLPHTDISVQGTQNETGITEAESVKKEATGISKILTYIIYLYWFGVIAFGLNFLLQLVALLRKAYTHPVIKDGRSRIVEVRGDKAPCSFGNNIFINPEKYDWDTYNQILLHEKIHIQQRHSLDILLAELVLIFQWFNPFAWLYRKELEHNLEFLTDARLLEGAAVEKTSYQMSLLKVSAPHFPLSLTTNYNQSILKKRLVMMNARKSNIHTIWKYLFLLPILVFFVCLLNEPVARSQTIDSISKKNDVAGRSTFDSGLFAEGEWFATIKGDKITMQLKNNGDDLNSFSSSFLISEFSALPKGQQGTFTLTREAGIMLFSGRFEGSQGMGQYKFTPDKDYDGYLKQQGIVDVKENDLLTFFLIDVTKKYIQMLKTNGYSNISKNELIPVAAHKIDDSYIRFWKQNGYKEIKLQELVALKSRGIDSAYVNDIRRAGYTELSIGQLISLKSRGIDGEYIRSVNRNSAKQKNSPVDTAGVDELIAIKSRHIDSSYIISLKKVGYEDVSQRQLLVMKSLDITPEFIRSFQTAGYKEIPVPELIALKSKNVTSEFIKGFTDLGYTNIDLNDVIRLKVTGVTPDYVVSMKQKGFDYKNLNKYIQLKNMN